jgi:hypothetical protein
MSRFTTMAVLAVLIGGVAQKAEAADQPVAISKIVWNDDTAGERHFTVTFASPPSPTDSDVAISRLKTLSKSEGYVLDGTTGSSPGATKNDRKISIGYKTATDKPVLVSLTQVSMAAGIVKYEVVYTQKPDATKATDHGETMARQAYNVTAADKDVKAVTETKIDGKKATVTVTFSGGKFDFLKSTGKR